MNSDSQSRWMSARTALFSRNGVAKRLLVALILCSAVITALITAGELYLRYVSEVRKIKDDFSFISDIYQPVLIESVWVLDEKQIAAQLDGLLRLPHVRYVDIVVDGQVRWSAGRRDARIEVTSDIPLVYQRGNERKSIGTLHVVAAEDDIISSLWEQLTRTLIANAIKTALVGVFMLMVFQMLVTRHLIHLGRYLKSLPGDGEPAPLQFDRVNDAHWRPDILDEVTDSVNETVSALLREQEAARVLTAKLGKSEAMFRSIFTEAGSAIIVVDAESLRVTEANEGACVTLGYSYQEMLQLRLSDYQIDLADAYVRELMPVLDSGSGLRMFGRHRRKDGELIDVDESLSLVAIDGQRFLVHVWRDVTEQKHMERELARTRDELSLMAESVPVAVYRLQRLSGGEVKFLYISPPILQLTGLPASRLLDDANALLEVIHPDDREAFVVADREAFNNLSPLSSTFRIVPAPGETRWIMTSSQPRYEAGHGMVWYGYMQDVTEQETAAHSLKLAQERFRATFESSPFGILITRVSDGVILMANQGFERCFGWSEDEVLGQSTANLLWESPEMRSEWLARVDVEKHLLDAEVRMRCKDGHLLDVSLSYTLFKLDGEPCSITCLVDISERVQARKAERRAAGVFANSVEGIIICDAQNHIIDVNPAFNVITGYSLEEVLGHDPSILSSGRQRKEFFAEMWRSLKEHDFWRGEIWNRRKNGEVFPELLSISAVRNDRSEVTEYIGVFADISRMKAHEEELHRIAYYDALTGLPNRRLLNDRLALALSRARRENNLLALCLLDLDGFKPINDQHGHATGDRFLSNMASNLAVTLRGGDTLARLGGDEFVMLFGNLANEQECRHALQRVLDIVKSPVHVDGLSLSVSASIGVTIFPQDDADADALLRHADQAMYRAKDLGKNRYHFFDPEHDRRQSAHRDALLSLQGAFERREFVLWYQPKIDLRSGEIVGAEALIRWQQPDGTLVPPASFLPHMEGEDLELSVSEWVIEQALDDLSRFHVAGLKLQVSANMVSTHLAQTGFISWLRDLLAEYPHYKARDFCLEVLESAAIGDIDVVARQLESVRAMGIELALDDFGTGYSSLAYFRRLPVDVLKIDQGFVRDMLEDASDHNIVESVIRLAEVFQRRAIAEGVETLEHWQALLGLGCDYGQGYGIARPMPFDKFIEWAARWSETSEQKAFLMAAQGYRALRQQ